MILHRIGLLAVDSSRSRAYIAALARADLIPARVVYLGAPNMPPPDLPSVPYFDNDTPLLDSIRRLDIPCIAVTSTDVNAPDTVAAVRDCGMDVLIYSGPGGAILRRDMLDAGVRFLHVHSGLLPKYRGSTTVYYSLLIDHSCGASAIFLEDRIDTGPVLGIREYPPPDDRTTIDHGYDPYIRADLLVRVLREYVSKGEFVPKPQVAGPAETYYIMHPVLRHVATLSRTAGTSKAAHTED